MPELREAREIRPPKQIAFAGRRAGRPGTRSGPSSSSEIDRSTPNLAPYEKIKKIAVLDRDFEIEREELTPTLKVKRSKVEEKFKDLIDALYKE